MNKSEFINLHKMISIKASKLLICKGEHKHTAILGNGKDLYMVNPNGNGEEITKSLGPICDSIGAEYLFLIFEAWAAPDSNTRASEHPEKKEVLFISAQHKEHGDKVVQYEIVRSANKIVKLIESGSEIDAIGGRLSALLPGGNGTGDVVDINRHPGYKSHFKCLGFRLH